MRTAKIKKSNKEKELEKNEQQYSLKQIIITITIIIAIFFIFYFITTLVIDTPKLEQVDAGQQIGASKITMNQLLTRKENEYYVLATKESKYAESNYQINYMSMYNNYIREYNSNEDENLLSFYTIDLDDALNKNFVGEELNVTEDLSNLKVNDEILFKIKDDKIKEYFVGSSEILDELKNLKS